MAAGSDQRLHGKRGAIYLFAKKESGGTKITDKTEWTLDLGRDYVDATVFGDSNKVWLTGLRNIQGTIAGLLDTSGDFLVNASASETEQLYLYADDTNNNSTGAPILIAFGPALLDAAITASNTDALKCTGNFRASGAWTVFASGTL
jgi:hypothetical protein